MFCERGEYLTLTVGGGVGYIFLAIDCKDYITGTPPIHNRQNGSLTKAGEPGPGGGWVAINQLMKRVGKVRKSPIAIRGYYNFPLNVPIIFHHSHHARTAQTWSVLALYPLRPELIQYPVIFYTPPPHLTSIFPNHFPKICLFSGNLTCGPSQNKH